MLEHEIIKEFIVSFLSIFSAILSAGIIWIAKTSYEKHRKITLSLAKLERTFAVNLTRLKDNFDFLERWKISAEKNRPFSCQFASYITRDEETYQLENLDLINKVLSLNYVLERTSLDFDNFRESYWDIITKINSTTESQENKEKNIKTYHENVYQTLQSMEKNYTSIEADIIDVISLIRAVNNVRKHSLFGYAKFLFMDIYPRVTHKNIGTEKKKLLKNIEEKRENRKQEVLTKSTKIR